MSTAPDENEQQSERSEEPQGIEVFETAEVIESVEAVEVAPTDTAAIDSALARAEASLDAAEHAAEPAEPAEAAEPIDAPVAEAAEPVELAEPVVAEPVEADAHAAEHALAAAAVGSAASTVAPAPGFGEVPQTVYVQAPVAPKVKSNRGFALGVAAVGSGIFAALYAGATWLVLSANDRAEVIGQFVQSPVFWLPTLAFLIGFALLGAVLNRAGWWAWAVFGLLLGGFVYAATIGAELIAVQAWTLSPAMATEFLRQRWLDIYVILATLIAREIPVWLGAWIARNGRKVTRQNAEALEEYERQLATGPIL